MRSIKILGIGSAKYRQLAANLKTAIQELNLDAELEQLEEVEDFIRYNIIEIPSIMIDDEIQIIGRGPVPDVQSLKEMLLNGNSQK